MPRGLGQETEPTSEGFVDKVTTRLYARAFREAYGLGFVETRASVKMLTAVRACLWQSCTGVQVTMEDSHMGRCLSVPPQ